MKSIDLRLKPADRGHWFVVNQGSLYLTDTIQVPEGEWQALPINEPEMICRIGEWQGQTCYLVVSNDHKAVPEHWHSPRVLLQHAETFWFEMAAKACQFALFLQTHRFCGQCGNKMHLVNWELAMLCHKCGHRCYPRISPCVLVAIVKEQQILLARSSRHKPGYFSILAGFVESGETLEQAAAREVKEEVGLDIANLRYAGSQPWPFPHSLMVGFIADYAGGNIRCQPDEIEEAHWFPLAQLPSVPPAESLSGAMIAQVVTEALGQGTDVVCGDDRETHR
jgi:NAD+ diphosphatase